MELALGNIFVRQSPKPLRIGEVVCGHAHNFDHVTFINRGAFRITRGQETVTVSALDENPYILIKAGQRHELVALEDDSMYYCVYSHRTPEGDVIQEYSGWDRAHR